MHPDQTYIERIRANDPFVFDELYQSHFGPVNSWICLNSGNTHDAKDVMQEVEIILWNNAKNETRSLKIEKGISHYILGTSKNIWLNILRSRRKEEKMLSSLKLEMEFAYVLEPIDDENLLAIRLNQALQKMGKTCQEIIDLYGKGVKPEEAAEELNMKKNVYMSSKSRCINQLKELTNSETEKASTNAL